MYMYMCLATQSQETLAYNILKLFGITASVSFWLSDVSESIELHPICLHSLLVNIHAHSWNSYTRDFKLSPKGKVLLLIERLLHIKWRWPPHKRWYSYTSIPHNFIIHTLCLTSKYSIDTACTYLIYKSPK